MLGVPGVLGSGIGVVGPTKPNLCWDPQGTLRPGMLFTVTTTDGLCFGKIGPHRLSLGLFAPDLV